MYSTTSIMSLRYLPLVNILSCLDYSIRVFYKVLHFGVSSNCCNSLSSLAMTSFESFDVLKSILTGHLKFLLTITKQYWALLGKYKLENFDAANTCNNNLCNSIYICSHLSQHPRTLVKRNNIYQLLVMLRRKSREILIYWRNYQSLLC